ncbi:MAG TPA: M14 family zinc carboxypeptidase [Actinomycetes bacterium]|jgi:predicted deacylase|nr:M14 family zinc carboxypeptidase [Actinomycetes bacterium]
MSATGPPAASSDEFSRGLQALASANSTLCARRPLPEHATESGREIHYLEIKPAGASADRPVAVLLAGLHARELAPPAAVFSFARRLVEAYAAKADITYPAFSDGSVPYGAWQLTADDVRRIVDALTILVVPVANPDGRDHALTVAPGWRGNRNTTDCSGFGVDLNRNFAIGWDTSVYYAAADEAVIVPNATAPTCINDSFRGLSAGSEKETQNIQRLIDDNDVRYLVDVHSAGRRVLMPWGLAENQETSPSQNFANTVFDRHSDGTGGRSVLNGTYKEFVPNDRPDQVLLTHDHIAQAMIHAIRDQAGANSTASSRSIYRKYQIPYLYKEFWNLPHILPVPGSSVDYALARQFKAGEPKPAYAVAMEIGWEPIPGIPGSDPVTEGGFIPSSPTKYQKIEREAHAALAAFLRAAVGPASTTGRSKKK